MRKAEMVQRIAQELGCTTAKAEAAVEAILTTIKASLQRGEPVILRRFGTWQVRAKRARVGRNPKTGRRGRHSRPAGRALPRGPTVQAGRRWSCSPRWGTPAALKRPGRCPAPGREQRL
jgi:nucleoid DNA-binding protein